jgi:hypothetical protein
MMAYEVHRTRTRGSALGCAVVLLGAELFVTSCFLPYYGVRRRAVGFALRPTVGGAGWRLGVGRDPLDVELAKRLDDVRAEALAARLRHAADGGVVPIEAAKR